MPSPFDFVPQRVVSLIPSMTETLFDLGIGERVVGITKFCARPAEKLKSLPRVGGTKDPDIQKIIALKPDLVLMNAEENRREDKDALEKAGLKIWTTEPRTVFEALNILWDVMDVFEAPQMSMRVREIERAYDYTEGAMRANRLIRVFVPIWKDPWRTIGKTTYMHDLLNICGGQNIFAEQENLTPLRAEMGESSEKNNKEVSEGKTRYPEITLQQIAEKKPEVILLPSEPYAFTEKHADIFYDMDIPAAKSGHIYTVDGSLLSWHGTRLAYALQELPPIFDRVRKNPKPIQPEKTMTEHFFENLFTGLSLPGCIINQDGEVLAWNDALYALTGVMPEMALNHSLPVLGTLATLIYNNWLPVKKIFAATRGIGHQVITFEQKVYTLHFMSVSYTPGGWLIFIEETPGADEKKKRDEEMISVVSHQLKAPLSAMKGFIELATHAGPVNEKQQHFLGRSTQAIDRMLRMIHLMIDSLKLDTDLPLERKPLDMKKLVQAVVEIYQEQAEEQRITFKLEIQNVPTVMGDEQLITHVVDNLITNALKYSPDGGEVTVRVNRQDPGQHVKVSVQDMGIGIAPEHLDKIFTRFYRVRSAKTHRIKGSGLGLSICQTILKKHDSELQVKSEPGKGSLFWFTLPIAD